MSMLPETDIPLPLQASVDRHHSHLARLVRTLKTAGLDDDTIEASVTTLVDSYRTELLSAIHAMKCESHKGSSC